MVQVTTDPRRRGKADCGLQKPLPRGCPHLHENHHGTSYCHIVWVTENSNHNLFPPMLVFLQLQLHTQLQVEADMCSSCFYVTWFASWHQPSTRVFSWAWIMVQHTH